MNFPRIIVPLQVLVLRATFSENRFLLSGIARLGRGVLRKIEMESAISLNSAAAMRLTALRAPS